MEHLSVKPGPKRLNFYGQTAIFDHFVRNRHFSSEPFTDRRPIFIDVSVNGSDFVKCSTRSISTSRRDYGQSAVLELFVRKNKQKLAAIAHPSARGDKSRQKPSKMSESCLPPRPKSVRTEAKVDKNRSKCLNLVYRADEDSARRSENRPDSVIRTKTTLLEIVKASVHVLIRGTLYPCGGTKKKQ